MGFFSKRQQRTSTPDLTEMVAATLAAAGFTAVQMNADEFQVNGKVLYLTNLRRFLQDVPHEHWQAEVTRWVSVMTSEPERGQGQGIDDVRDILLPRITHRDMFGSIEDSAAQAAQAARHLTPDLYLLPALDHPDRVETVTSLETYGGWEAIWPVAQANLRALPAPSHSLLDAPAEMTPDAVVHLLETEDFFGATRVLILAETLSRALGQRVEAPLGMIVAMPSRHILGVHVITSAAGVVGATELLSSVATADLPGPLSDLIHYVSPDGSLQPISSRGKNGLTSILAQGAFGEVLAALPE